MEKLTALQLHYSILNSKGNVAQNADKVHLDILFRIVIEIYRYCHFNWLYFETVYVDLWGSTLLLLLFG